MTVPDRPASIDELQERLSSPKFQESRSLEYKREFPRSNGSLAKHLAGFAAEGGALVIGVEETTTGLAVAPIDINAARERVEQIARDIPEPSVQVESFALLSSAPGRGVLWIEIPASSAMLHQVNGTYYERGDTQTRPMSDADVADRMSLRANRTGPIDADLEAALSRDEPGRRQWQGRTCVVARPVGTSHDEFYRSTQTREDWESFAYSLLQPSGMLPPTANSYWGILKSNLGPNADNVLHSGQLFSYRDIEFHETGGFCHLSYCRDWYGDRQDQVYPYGALLSCREVLQIVREVQDHTGQRRMWDFAFSVSNVQGLTARTSVHERFHPARYIPPIPRDAYRSSAIGVSSQRLESEPRAVIADLTERFIAECGPDFDQELPASWFAEPQ